MIASNKAITTRSHQSMRRSGYHSLRVRKQMTIHGTTPGTFSLPFPLEKDTHLLQLEEENRKPNWQLQDENSSAWHVQCCCSSWVCFFFCPEANLSQEFHLDFSLSRSGMRFLACRCLPKCENQV